MHFLRRLGEEIQAGVVVRESVEMSELDPELLQELRGLGYVGN